MAQGLLEEARELERAGGLEGWVAVGPEWVENAYAQIAVIEQLTKEVYPVMRLVVPKAGQQ